jgi:F0F1-type ATP synthase membrane subunit b/b'
MISEPAASQITCPKCQAVSAPVKKYCADCGASLTINADIRTLIDDQIQQIIDTKFKDQKLVELETTDAIIDRITSWAKRFAFWAGVPLALFIICLAILGVQKFGDFSSKIDQAVAKITPILDQSIKQANEAEAKSGAAQKTAEAAQLKASEALASIDTIVEQTKTQLASDVNSKIQSISPRLKGFEKTAAEIEQTSTVVLKQVDDVKKELDAASETITAQEKKITDTGELVKAMFDRSRTDSFEPTATPDHMAIIKHDDSHASVYLLLQEVPIEASLQLQYHVFSQPKNSYNVLRSGDVLVNVVGFRWGENSANLVGKILTASYIGDPTAQSAHFKSLTVKEDRAYADGVPLPYLYPQYEPKQ